MMSRVPLWLALRIVRAVALLVPAASRADWMREWEAELRYRSGRQDQTWSANMDLITRALGSVPDAAWIRRQFTLDADVVQDVAHGVRMLLTSPSFTAIALLVFAVGIGATTAIVSLADALLVRPLPIPQADRVMTVWQYNRDTRTSQEDVAPGNAIDWMKRARSFEVIAMAEPYRVNSAIPGREPEQSAAARVSENFFTALGTSMLHGRTFLPQEYRKGAGRVAIVSYPLWRDRFGSDASLVGQAVRLDDAEPVTVVGVLPPAFELRLFDNRLTQPEPLVWLPKQGFEKFEPTLRDTGYWNVLGRLAPGVSIDQARAEFEAQSAQLAREYPQSNKWSVSSVMCSTRHWIVRPLPSCFFPIRSRAYTR